MVDRITTMATEYHTRFIAFRGSRADALERLPSVCPQERLEFGINRISLVSQRERVDLLILAELDGSQTEYVHPMMLVELRFNSSSVSQIDDFIERLQREHRGLLH